MKIKAFGKTTRIPMALSNYMAGCREGFEVARQELIDTIEAQPMDVMAVCKALNSHRWTTERFEPYRPLDYGFSIIATDPFGNQDIIQIIEE